MKTFTTNSRTEQVVSVECAACGSDNSILIFEDTDATFVKFTECGLVYQNPQPIFSELKHRYKQDYFEYEQANESNFFHLMKLGLTDIHFDRRMAGIFDKTVLDIGCATGMLLSYLRDRDWEVYGVDICRESAEYAMNTRNVPVFAGTVHEARFPENTFSVVHCSHLIEHLVNPKEFLFEVQRILTQDGYVIITTPNVEGFQAKIFQQNWRSAISDHLYLFSKHTLRKLLQEVGFTILQTVTWGGIAKGAAPGFIKRPLDILAKRYGFGDVMLFLAQKKDM